MEDITDTDMMELDDDLGEFVVRSLKFNFYATNFDLYAILFFSVFRKFA